MDEEVQSQQSLEIMVTGDPEQFSYSSPAQLSLHALSGHVAPETLRLKGSINDQQVSILIDGGSTHNFLHHRIVLLMGLEVQETTPLRVTVGNGDELCSHQMCQAVKVYIQNHTFSVEFHILPNCGADVVLGVQWLKTLGLVLTDYNALTMKFILSGQVVELHGDHDTSIDAMSSSQLRRLLHTHSASTFFHILLEAVQATDSPDCPASEIAALTAKYASLFQPL